MSMDIHKAYDPKSFWDARARRAGRDFELAVGVDDPVANKTIDRIQKRFVRMAFRQIGQRMELAGKKILDYGCGTGRWVEFFQNYGMQYTGVDISTEMVRIAMERFPNVDFSSIGPEGLHFPPQTFDVICSIAVIHHNPYEEQISILRQLTQLLKYEGFFFLFESIGTIDAKNVVEFPRPSSNWIQCLQVLGLERVWSKQTRYFSTRMIMNKLVGENRLSSISNKLSIYLDPYIGNFLPPRLQTRGVMVFKKL